MGMFLLLLILSVGVSSNQVIKSNKSDIIKFISVKTISEKISFNTIKKDFIHISSLEGFALNKGSVKEFYIWSAPKISIGKPWPQPLKMQQHEKNIIQIADQPDFLLLNRNCALLKTTMERYKERIFQFKMVTHVKDGDVTGTYVRCTNNKNGRCLIKKIKLSVRHCSSEDWPGPDMNEAYVIKVNVNEIKVTSEEIWGMLRALETLSHLVYRVVSVNNEMFVINEAKIFDKPIFSYRGLLLDTSRHFIPLEDIILILNGMEMNKLNVFHWHLTDDSSFPFGSKLHPELHEKGAFEPSLIYTYSNITFIVEYARQRGIRVIPEIDVPGHTASWSKSHPELMSQCKEMDGSVLSFGPLNPILLETYMMITDLYTELFSLFPDKYIHIGMDEVGIKCWRSDPNILAFMRSNNIRSYESLMSIFFNELQKIINIKFPKKNIVIWQEGFETSSSLSNRTIIQIWKNELNNIDMFLPLKLPLIYSTDFYIDRVSYGSAWVNYFKSNFGNHYIKMFIGGEACMWNEYQSKETVHQKIWPVMSVIAEKLWYGVNDPILTVASRLEEQRCRMLRNRIKVGVASGPSECFHFKENFTIFDVLNTINPNMKSVNIMEILKFYFIFNIGIVFGLFSQFIRSKLHRYMLVVFFLPIFMILFHIWLLIQIFRN